MLNARRLAALLSVSCLALIPARAKPVELDAGLRAVIYTDDYKLGLGAELGAIVPASPAWDLGLHLNYTHFAAKNSEDIGGVPDENEFGAYVTAYFKPAIDQGFSLRLGPHLGYANIKDHFLDLGADAMAVFKVTPVMSFYGAFVPSFLIGSEAQSLFRVGFGVEYSTGL